MLLGDVVLQHYSKPPSFLDLGEVTWCTIRGMCSLHNKMVISKQQTAEAQAFDVTSGDYICSRAFRGGSSNLYNRLSGDFLQ
ncbi:hypothetical protein GDO81_018283 [Engystomops pustulosus]|uniref:Uncharacterized protein n=1 Tax=Engystomops pustulosus TaxID=76066 RepID=A0AAV7A8A7_ENGPU|nr:hypothetical protein GDO81_018283 [Engystomops pustulosus]